MSDVWYYVQAGERKGPVEIEEVLELISKGTLGAEDYVWKKGLENWAKVVDMPELKVEEHVEETEIPSEIPIIEKAKSNNLYELTGDTSSIFIKIGADRGGQETEYGPYNIETIKKLFKENRINAKTFVFVKGMDNWQLLADFDDYVEIFEDSPPPIKEEDRRKNTRKPFVARMYIQNKEEVFIGICRDISVGGMQVLVDHFPAQIGERISINVHPENTDYHFVAAGNIVRLLDGSQGFSFRFTDLPDPSKESINKYLMNA